MTILVGYVPTATGEAALARATLEGRLRGENLLVVNSAREAGALVEPTVASEEDLARVAAAVGAEGVEARVLRASHRDVVDELLELAVTHDVSMIVIGVRRRSPVGKLVLGSKTQRIILDADRPVLLARPPLA